MLLQKQNEKSERETEESIDQILYLLGEYPSELKYSQLKLEISVFSVNQDSHSPAGCLFPASKHSTDAVKNFIIWKFGHWKSSEPIWLILDWVGWLSCEYMTHHDASVIPHNSCLHWHSRSQRISSASEEHGKRQEKAYLKLEVRIGRVYMAEHESGSLLTVLWIRYSSLEKHFLVWWLCVSYHKFPLRNETRNIYFPNFSCK